MTQEIRTFLIIWSCQTTSKWENIIEKPTYLARTVVLLQKVAVDDAAQVATSVLKTSVKMRHQKAITVGTCEVATTDRAQ